MCVIDWTAIAAWIGSLATLGLLIAAVLGFYMWKKQFFGQRDHNLALKILQRMHLSSKALRAFRSPVPTMIDEDVPLGPPGFDDPNYDYEYRRLWARYRSRRQRVFESTEERLSAIHDATVVWPDLRPELTELGEKLAVIETEVIVEARKYVESHHPGFVAPEECNREVLFFSGDGEDAIHERYSETVEEFSKILEKKIHMN